MGPQMFAPLALALQMFVSLALAVKTCVPLALGLQMFVFCTRSCLPGVLSNIHPTRAVSRFISASDIR
jgi:hypothetical protein